MYYTLTYEDSLGKAQRQFNSVNLVEAFIRDRNKNTFKNAINKIEKREKVNNNKINIIEVMSSENEQINVPTLHSEYDSIFFYLAIGNVTKYHRELLSKSYQFNNLTK